LPLSERPLEKLLPEEPKETLRPLEKLRALPGPAHAVPLATPLNTKPTLKAAAANRVRMSFLES
jgi:hypothetical protein